MSVIEEEIRGKTLQTAKSYKASWIELGRYLQTIYKDKMYKIINNLLSNSFKFTPQGGAVTVHLSHSVEKQNSGFIQLKGGEEDEFLILGGISNEKKGGKWQFNSSVFYVQGEDF
jgi:signal transduction histidine kinase